MVSSLFSRIVKDMSVRFARGKMAKMHNFRRRQMDKQKIEDIINRLITVAAELRYGTASVLLKVHDGQIVSVSQEKTEICRKREVLK
jgi:hypothetical protein